MNNILLYLTSPNFLMVHQERAASSGGQLRLVLHCCIDSEGGDQADEDEDEGEDDYSYASA